jgi:transposase
VDRHGIPLAAYLSPAHITDSRLLGPALAAVPPIHRPRGRPRRRPAKLHADKGYDYPGCHLLLRLHRIVDRIARRGIESSTRLGRYRWVVERTLAWLARYRRLTIRYERRLDLHQAFTTLACSLICWNYLQPML